jgi:hypothetical protein
MNLSYCFKIILNKKKFQAISLFNYINYSTVTDLLSFLADLRYTLASPLYDRIKVVKVLLLLMETKHLKFQVFQSQKSAFRTCVSPLVTTAIILPLRLNLLYITYNLIIMALSWAITTTGICSSIKAIGPLHFRCWVPFSVNIRYFLSFKAPSSATGNYNLDPTNN